MASRLTTGALVARVLVLHRDAPILRVPFRMRGLGPKRWVLRLGRACACLSLGMFPNQGGAAVELYGRGFEVKRDYYNGENYASCLLARKDLQADPAEAEYDWRTARKVLERVRTELEASFKDETTRERKDYMWMLATMANVCYALGRSEATKSERDFYDLKPPRWAIDTFKDGKAALEKARISPAAAAV
jgi:hypothetical protein